MKERIAVTGAGGWLGRELAHVLSFTDSYEVLFLARRASHISLAGSKVQVHSWTRETLLDWQPTTLVHLAFLTRDRMQDVGLDRYVTENLELRHRVIEAMAMPSLRSLVYVSSGAALSTEMRDPYSELKSGDEESFHEAGRSEDVRVLTARAWSLSGRFCTKPRALLLYDVLSQVADGHGEISLTSSCYTWRRYVDAGEYLWTCLNASLAGYEGTVDSTGDLVEAADLANLAGSVLGRQVRVVRPNLQGGHPASVYYSNSEQMESFMRLFKISRTTLAGQLLRSLEAL